MSEPGTEGYTASKGGIIALTHGMAISLARHRIRVNFISPGWIEVGDWQKASKGKRTGTIPRPTGSSIRWGAWVVPEDIAKACRFIAEEAGFMTGQNLILDGGMTVKMIYVESGATANPGAARASRRDKKKGRGTCPAPFFVRSRLSGWRPGTRDGPPWRPFPAP